MLLYGTNLFVSLKLCAFADKRYQHISTNIHIEHQKKYFSTSNLTMMSTDDDTSTTSCANCGKEGSNLNSCNRCKLVKYCNAACKKKHRSKHKKKCDRRVAEMHDEDLFKQPPRREDCPICFLRLPTLDTGRRYKSCCGKKICSGCFHAPVYDNNGNKV